MKRIPLLAALAVGAALFASSPGASSAEAELPVNKAATAGLRTISVSGDAEVNVAPDEAFARLGVDTRDAQLLVAKRQNDERVARVLSLVGSLGIDAKDVRTDYISLTPLYEDGYERTNVVGYAAHTTITVTLRDMRKIERLLIGALEAGANRVDGVDFVTTELKKHRDEARALAVKAAQDKARALAAKLGQRIGQPLVVAEAAVPPAWAGQQLAQVAVTEPGEPDLGVGSIVPGHVTVRAKILVTFQLLR
ncbi:SIMPL domain-containing protein [Polyangium jinanense]|uniref:SIMPL domain-containing protein n=1 Tax=Polyangium jinanense TaxID=2829994 RepID=A0A9X3XE73_9BACT|nr:SIMPL domain-containing protein [Polyangium jinanense]MDC3962194.1 SIMPL domain-containing protein [Polyangium jinanense]MDC3988739.1 SIMPL domain-containing protein [Polyangium jinanense]